ncbi:MAG TPA: PAS-domain containing protein [Rhizomicrobium sp.]|jgi:signal transduction histidine kinase|nr:PAS-domain containing protein [Rhizomicrobium sp.]
MSPNPGQKKKPGGWLAWLVGLALLTPQPALAAGPDYVTIESGRMVVLSALAAGAIALAMAAGLWAVAEQCAASRLRRTLKASGARTRAAVGEREALLGASREALVVWGRETSGPLSYGGGDEALQSCLKGPDALALSSALDGLSDRGAGFVLPVQDQHGKKLVARGRAVGAMAAVWLEEPQAPVNAADFHTVLDALPIPVWLRDKALALVWGNQAFLNGAGVADLETARHSQAALDKTERDLAASARTQNATLEARRFSVIGGHRRALAFTEIPMGEAGIIGTAVDVTEIAAAEARLQQHVDAHADTLDKLATAVAIFGSDQKLSFFNRAFAKLWNLPEPWLDSHPFHNEILDRLREARKLPEQRDYQAWKRQRLTLYSQARDRSAEELWHIPGGQTMRVVTQPHPFGGLSFLYEDVTERLALESNYNTLIKVQSATLDTLVEGVAVFGPDGKLKLHNAAFARIWDLSEKDLAGEPHVRTIATVAAQRFGDSEPWDRLILAIVSGPSQKRDLGEVERADRTILSLGLSPLPDGATLATFADVTDRFRIETALRDRNEALEAADRLKSDFIKHVSYELRTPLNSILGFSEHLASGVPGALNPRQTEYVNAIVEGGTTLKNLVNDILDLALVESGALRLELERIELADLVGDIAAHAQEWAGKVGLTLEVQTGGGKFLADARRLRQVIFNLLSNAFKYTPRGGTIRLIAAIVGEDVQIAVADNGPGLAPEVKANAFERFSAKNRAGQRAGAGLGLALVNRFMELHDGWVEIESGNGTLVRCHLPRRVHDDVPPPEVSDDRKTAYL